MTVIIAIDPSLTATGIAAFDLEARKVIEWACVRTEKDAKYKATEDTARRILLLAKEVRVFLARFASVSVLYVIEGQVGASMGARQASGGFAGGASQGSTGLLMAGYGAILACLPKKPIVIHSATVKARLGKKDGSKDYTWEVAKQHFDALPAELSTKVAREAVHDAVAIGISALPEIEQLLAMAA